MLPPALRKVLCKVAVDHADTTMYAALYYARTKRNDAVAVVETVVQDDDIPSHRVRLLFLPRNKLASYMRSTHTCAAQRCDSKTTASVVLSIA